MAASPSLRQRHEGQRGHHSGLRVIGVYRKESGGDGCGESRNACVLEKRVTEGGLYLPCPGGSFLSSANQKIIKKIRLRVQPLRSLALTSGSSPVWVRCGSKVR
ncbi:hypothetical protein MRX96_013774 [Rhipicephalus microplus]